MLSLCVIVKTMEKKQRKMNSTYHMKSALRLAHKAYTLGESPIGCVIVKEGKIIARGYNLRQTRQDVTGHAEIMALRQACRRLGSWRLEDCDLYVTLEPCAMCAGAIIQARIRKVYFGATDPKAGAVSSSMFLFDQKHNHQVLYQSGILAEESKQLLQQFFKELRAEKRRRRESAKSYVLPPAGELQL